MYTDVKITAKEFTAIHNALCEMRDVNNRLSGVVREPITDKLAAAIRAMEQGLAGAYQQDEQDFDAKSNHYSDVSQELGTRSVWSVYEVNDLKAEHPYIGATEVVYKDHWGGEEVVVPVIGNTWEALYVAADSAIRNSKDNHHIFIETFTQSSINPSILFLSTGS
jgi:hypothetical protein